MFQNDMSGGNDGMARELYSIISSWPSVVCHARFSAACYKQNRAFSNLAELWFPDERKERAMRACGVAEMYIGGNASDFEKVAAFLAILPRTMGSALYMDAKADLAALECELLPDAAHVAKIWQQTAFYLQNHEINPTTVLKNSAFSFLSCTPADLVYLPFADKKVRPLLCLDMLFAAHAANFTKNMDTVANIVGFSIKTLADLKTAIDVLCDWFGKVGAPAVTVELSGYAKFCRPDPYHAQLILQTALAGKGNTLSSEELLLYHTQVLRMLGRALAAHDMRMILRVRAARPIHTGNFSVAAFCDLLRYLDKSEAFVPTCLTFAADFVPPGLVSLLGAFSAPSGTPRLYFGLDVEGVSEEDIAHAFRLFLSRGALPVFLGVTDDDAGFYTRPSYLRFCRVVAAALAKHAGDESEECLCNARHEAALHVLGGGLSRFFMSL